MLCSSANSAKIMHFLIYKVNFCMHFAELCNSCAAARLSFIVWYDMPVALFAFKDAKMVIWFVAQLWTWCGRWTRQWARNQPVVGIRSVYRVFALPCACLMQREGDPTRDLWFSKKRVDFS